MTLRPAEESDAAALAALSIEVWVGTYLRQGVSSFFARFALETFTEAHFLDALGNPRETFIVSQNTDGIDGFVRLHHGKPCPVPGAGDLEISSLYVQPRHHGRGIGRALLAAAYDTAKANGHPELWLASNAENSPAIAFYLSQGWEIIGETAFHIEDQSYANTVLRLKRDVL